MKNIYVNLFDRLKKKKPVVMAAIVETKGSTPQVCGASALFSSEGLLEGTLGGGLLEADAQKKALRALEEKTSLLSEFNLKADISLKEGAICGGEVKILIDSCPEEHKKTFHNLSQSLIKRRSGVLATFINELSKNRASIVRYWIEKDRKLVSNQEKHLFLFQKEIKTVLSKGSARLMKIKENIFPEKTKNNFLFLEPIYPLPQLVIAGAGHIGQAVAHLGSLLNFEVTVIDDRDKFANKERLPDTDLIIVKNFNKALKDIPISPDTYMVIVTREHHHDTTVLRQCLTSKAAYIGMIGSSRKIGQMRKKFLEEGWATSQQFGRVYAPIGIDINSKTVQEIAVSIAAQLAFVRSQIRNDMRA